MPLLRTAKILAAFAVLSIGLPSSALADDGTPMGSGMMGMLQMMGMRYHDCPMGAEGMRGMLNADQMTRNADERLGKIKSELAITPAQEVAWTAYADAIKSGVKGMAVMRQVMLALMQAGSAKERLPVRITTMETMLKALKASQSVTETLYQALTDASLHLG